MGFTGVYNIIIIFAQKRRLWLGPINIDGSEIVGTLFRIAIRNKLKSSECLDRMGGLKRTITLFLKKDKKTTIKSTHEQILSSHLKDSWSFLVGWGWGCLIVFTYPCLI